MPTANDPTPDEGHDPHRPRHTGGSGSGGLDDLDMPPIECLLEGGAGLLPVCDRQDTAKAATWAAGVFVLGVVFGPLLLPEGLIGAWSLLLLMGGGAHVAWRCAEEWRPLLPAILVPVCLIALLAI